MKLLLVVIFFSAVSIALGADITGKVQGLDDNGSQVPLIKARVIWLNTNKGTLTDKDGKFRLESETAAHKLQISYFGYITDTVDITGKNNITITLNPIKLTDEVKVTAAKPGTIVSKSDMAQMDMITSRGLQKAACCNLAESFTTNATVDVQYADAVSGAKQIRMLGLDGTYVQMLTENVPYNHGLASKYGLSYIPGPWMESISVSKGMASVINGYESITGQINIEYKKPETAEPLYLNAFADQMGRFELNAVNAQKISPRLSTLTMLNGSLNQTPIDDNGDGFVDQPLVSQINLMNRWKYIGDGHEGMYVINAIYEDRKGGQVGFINDRPGTYGIDSKTTRGMFYTKNGFFLDDESSIGTILSATYHHQNSIYGNRKYDAEQISGYANLLYQSHLFNEDHSLTTGISFQYDKFNEFLDGIGNKPDYFVPGVFAEYSFSGIPNYKITTGVRVDKIGDFGTYITPRLHMKYDFTDKTIIRASIGKGERVPFILAENSSIFASSRKIEFTEPLKPEEAWNTGVNFSTDFELLGVYFTWSSDYYYTNFMNQAIVDLDRDPGYAYIGNLKGESYSHAFQTDLIIEPVSGITITTAYRYTQVMETTDGILRQKPLVPESRILLNFAYATPDDDWNFDFTADYNSKSRLPNTSGNPAEYKLAEFSPDFITFNMQLTKRFELWDVYFGIENIGGFRQENPILASNDPFGKYFDSSIIWGPISGQKAYLGIRLNFKTL